MVHSTYEKASQAVEYIKNRVSEIPEIAVVLGSGLGKFADGILDRTEISYEDIPNFPRSTVEGHAGKMIFGKVEGKPVVAMQGRFHLYEGYAVQDATLHIRVFQLLGIQSLIITNAAGAVNTGYAVGDLMLIEDHISFFSPSPLAGENDSRFGTRFPSMSQAYDRNYLQLAEQIAAQLSLPVRKGIYCYCKGPMFETPAEIRALRLLGADAAGMSTVPEVIAAVHGGLRVLGISCMTNMAAGILDVPLTHEEVMETGQKVEKDFSRFVREIIAGI